MILRKSDEWIRCELCGHKLARLEQGHKNCSIAIEFKCHSCKGITIWRAGGTFWKEKPNRHHKH